MACGRRLTGERVPGSDKVQLIIAVDRARMRCFKASFLSQIRMYSPIHHRCIAVHLVFSRNVMASSGTA